MRERVLLVSANEDFLEALELQLQCYQTVRAHDMGAALDVLKQGDVLVIITDHAPPQLDGVQLLENVQAFRPDVTQVLIPSYIDTRVWAAVTSENGPYFFHKPWNDEGLRVVLRRAAEHHQDRRRHRLSARRFRRNINSSLALGSAKAPEGVLRGLAGALEALDFVNSVRTYLLEKTVFRCISPLDGRTVPLHERNHPVVRTLLEESITQVLDDGCVELSIRLGGLPGPTGVLYALTAHGNADAMLLVRHLAQTASLRLCSLGVRDPNVCAAKELGEVLRRASLGDLLAAVVHEANNPLTSVIAHLELLAHERRDDPVVDEHLRALVPSLQRVTKILGRARSASRSAEDPRAAVDVCEELRLLAELVEHHYKTHNIKLELDLPPDCPTVEGSADRLQQVWLNLLANAFDAARQREDGRGRIRIKVRYYQKLKRLTVEFNDNGSGMPGEIVRWVNVADRNVEPPRSVHLGMREALRGIAEHDGIIRVTSSPVRGTTVQISLKTSDPLSSLC